uniref:NBS-LRR type disease resistance protein n=1 Tax=Populus trichocarpa TaxID=3694 RepID=Q19PN3_POPTR|nr:NBS-LRR type disease resistance protein [Populus trichocarpa]
MAGYADVAGSADVANDVARTDVVTADLDALTWLGVVAGGARVTAEGEDHHGLLKMVVAAAEIVVLFSQLVLLPTSIIISVTQRQGHSFEDTISYYQTRRPQKKKEKMVLPKGPFWEYVKETGESRQCTFCGHPFSKQTPITRFKLHWSGVQRRGTTICDKVPEPVRDAAFTAVDGPPEKKLTTTATSSNDGAHNTISTSLLEQNIQVGNVVTDVETEPELYFPSPGEQEFVQTNMGNFQLDRVSSFPGDLIPGEQVEQERGRNAQDNLPLSVEDYRIESTIEELNQLVVRGGSPERLTVNEDEPRGDLSQPTDPLCFGLERHYDQPSSSSVNNDVMMIDVENMIREHLQPVVRDSSREGLQPIGDESGRDVFLTEELRGGEFENNKNAIWSILLQDDIRLDLSKEDNERKRAAKLSKALIEKQRWVLILDDLWNCFDFDVVGIPIKVKGCKLILTTRSFEVCQRMVCQETIKVEPLSMEEAWALFTKILGRIPSEVEEIAKSMARECAGLPLGIKTMAGTMRGVDDICEWRNALEELKQSRVRLEDMDEEVFQILRFSYMHLKESALQQCFLHCALFPEDFMIPREDLIAYLIDEGVIKGLTRREAEFDKGHTMLNKLESACLLEDAKLYSGRRCVRAVKMHDLIRDMAIQILQENSQGMVKAGAQLRELPGAEEWTENLTRVSLMQNQIKEIPFSHSPRCPSLSTLLLCRNPKLQFIADSFFEQLHGLKVLDLSYTGITKLPDSVSELVSLTALLLIDCKMLRHVPSLEKLRALKRLDLSGTWALEKIPQGMECLCNLRYLIMNGCGEKEFPSGLLPKLSHLQVFVLEEWIPRPTGDYRERQDAPITVKGKEVGCLRKLESLACHFEGCSDYMEYLKSQDETKSLTTYQILVGPLDKYDYCYCYGYDGCRRKAIVRGNLSIDRDGGFQVMFPKDIQQLSIHNNDDATSLCDFLSLIKSVTELEAITIFSCNSMESLVSSSWFRSAPLPSPSYNGIFSSLKKFFCSGCSSMKKLFPLVLLPNLVKLEEITVTKCEKMEEIIGGTRSDEEGVMGEESSSSSITDLKLTKLSSLTLIELPELESICSAKLICDSLKEIAVYNCKKLKRMPICLPLLENGQPSPPPSLRKIERVKHPNACDVIRPFVEFSFVWRVPVNSATDALGMSLRGGKTSLDMQVLGVKGRD